MKTLEDRIKEKYELVKILAKQADAIEQHKAELKKLKTLRRRLEDRYWRDVIAFKDLEFIKYAQLPNPLRKIHYDVLYKLGVLRKEQLENRKYYYGHCRNSDVAMWDEKKNKFLYMRHKWHDVYVDEINHIQDDNFYDLFVPIKEVEPKDGERIVY